MSFREIRETLAQNLYHFLCNLISLRLKKKTGNGNELQRRKIETFSRTECMIFLVTFEKGLSFGKFSVFLWLSQSNTDFPPLSSKLSVTLIYLFFICLLGFFSISNSCPIKPTEHSMEILQIHTYTLAHPWGGKVRWNY